MQVVRVAEDDLRADRAHLVGVQRLHGRLGAHRHEDGRADLAVRGREHAGARGAVGGRQLEHQRISIASPKE
jgi:hypothetical protein